MEYCHIYADPACEHAYIIYIAAAYVPYLRDVP